MPAAARLQIAAAPRSLQPVRTLLDSSHRFDAGRMGYDGPTQIDEPGGLRVVFDGRYSVPTVILNGPDGEIEICGLSAISQLAQALEDAESMAQRMGG